MSLMCGAGGCFAANEADVCYSAWRAGPNGVTLRVGADPNAKSLGTASANARLGRQSTLNQGCSWNPSPRPQRNGYIWVYRLGGQAGAWVSLNECTGTNDWAACGPADQDFWCNNPTACPQGKCDGGLPDNPTSYNIGQRSITANEVYLRYSPQGTAFEWLVSGDKVTPICRAVHITDSGVRVAYYCVNVDSACFAPAGSRGWVHYTGASF